MEILHHSHSALTLLLVDPLYQRKGIGTHLINYFCNDLKKKGIKDISLGAGATKLLWHGVPCSLSHACSFFKKSGFIFEDEKSYDLLQDISEFRCPEEVLLPLKKFQFSIEAITSAESMDVLAFEKKYFPNWHHYFKDAISKRKYADILVAKRGEEILGSILLSVAPNCPGSQWRDFIGYELGAFGILGVAPIHRQQGIGLALAAKATEALKSCGIKKCFIHWTSLSEWYGKLGFEVWETYSIGKFSLLSPQTNRFYSIR